mgnify:CR=1 FL=1
MRLGELTHDLLRLASEIATLAERVDAGEPFGSDEREHLLAMLAGALAYAVILAALVVRDCVG